MIDPTTIQICRIPAPAARRCPPQLREAGAAARDVFAEDGVSATLDDIARRAEVGPATLYRHFPTRQHLLEAVYLEEVEAISRAAADLADLPPWDALAQWLREFVGYAATKRALANEMLASIDRDAESSRRHAPR